MFKIKRTVVKEVEEVLTFTNYAEYVLVQELHKQEKLLEAETVVVEDLGVGTPEYVDIIKRVEQLRAAIRATKEDNDLPF